METACKKSNDTCRKKELKHYTYHKSSNPFTIQNSASHDTLKARVFRNNTIPLRIYVI